MEANDILKPLQSTSTTKSGSATAAAAAAAANSGGTTDTKLTFGPAWLRQLSSGDPKTALPPSPGLAFQLSKHRYSREEMLAIFETIEKSLTSAPSSLANDFDELFRRDIQKPILLTAPSSEEQV